MCGVLLGEPTSRSGRGGTITTFCIVNVPFLGQQITPPYVAATIVLDGADIAHAAPDPGVRGRRGAHGHAGRAGVAAIAPSGGRRWRTSTTSGRPTSPTPPFDSYAGHLVMRDVAIVATVAARAGTARHHRTPVEMIVPIDRPRCWQRAGLERRDDRLLVPRQLRLHERASRSASSPAVDAIGAWPPIVESHVERTAPRALRSVDEDPDRRVRHGAGVRQRQVEQRDIDRILTLQLDPYVVAPLWPDAASLAALQARAVPRCRRRHRDGPWPRWRPAASARRARQPERRIGRGESRRRAARPTARRRRRCASHDCPLTADGVGGGGARRRRRRPSPVRPAGVDPRHRPSHRHPVARSRARSPSRRRRRSPADMPGVAVGDRLDVAELHAPYTPPGAAAPAALGLDVERHGVNPSGGALCAQPA